MQLLLESEILNFFFGRALELIGELFFIFESNKCLGDKQGNYESTRYSFNCRSNDEVYTLQCMIKNIYKWDDTLDYLVMIYSF